MAKSLKKKLCVFAGLFFLIVIFLMPRQNKYGGIENYSLNDKAIEWRQDIKPDEFADIERLKEDSRSGPYPREVYLGALMIEKNLINYYFSLVHGPDKISEPYIGVSIYISTFRAPNNILEPESGVLSPKKIIPDITLEELQKKLNRT